MNCEETRRLLGLYLDNQLKTGKRLELQQHLNDCLYCHLLRAQEREFRAVFATNAPFYRPPAMLRIRLVAELNKLTRET